MNSVAADVALALIAGAFRVTPQLAQALLTSCAIARESSARVVANGIEGDFEGDQG